MNCSEKELQTIIEKAVNQAVNQAVEPLLEEIDKLKAQQTETFKQILEETIQSQIAKMVDEKFEKLLQKADKLYEGEGELAGNQRELAKAILMVKSEIVKYFKETKESEDKILEQGEKVLEVLDDIGNALIKTQESVLDSNNQWGSSILDKFITIAQMIKSVEGSVENAKEYLRRNNDLTYDAVKRLDDTISRKW